MSAQYQAVLKLSPSSNAASDDRPAGTGFSVPSASGHAHPFGLAAVQPDSVASPSEQLSALAAARQSGATRRHCPQLVENGAYT